ncbi:MAG: PadR family transcriptional regulator [Ruminococcus sp.]|nr:PadR family transcriptional regulator [Ruminococcus sp.]
MSAASDLIRGHTDTIILSLLSLGDSYGYKINKDIMRLTGNRFEFKEATLYSAFRRLEQAGLIASYWGDDKSGQGARRRYYVITDAGRIKYKENLAEWERAKFIADNLLYAADNEHKGKAEKE